MNVRVVNEELFNLLVSIFTTHKQNMVYSYMASTAICDQDQMVSK